MSLGKRGPEEKQEPIWIEAARLATPVGHPFYERLNRLLSKRGFDEFAESACESFYAKTGRPGLAPGVYFRALLVGYFVADYRPVLPKIDKPGVVCAAKNGYMSTIVAMQKSIPNAKLEIFDGDGHALFVDDPDKFNALVEDFLLNLAR